MWGADAIFFRNHKASWQIGLKKYQSRASSYIQVPSGVPQGSVLDILLFIIMTGDIGAELRHS